MWRKPSRALSFSTRACARSPLATMRSVRSVVRSCVERTPIRSTVAMVPSNLQVSPTLSTRSATTDAPPNRLASVCCEASAMAAVPMPRPAITAERSSPKIWSDAAMPSSQTMPVATTRLTRTMAAPSAMPRLDMRRSTPTPRTRSQRTTSHAATKTSAAREPSTRFSRAGALRIRNGCASRMPSTERRKRTGVSMVMIGCVAAPNMRDAPWRISAVMPHPASKPARAMSTSTIHCQSSISATRTSTMKAGSDATHQVPSACAMGRTPSTVLAAKSQRSSTCTISTSRTASAQSTTPMVTLRSWSLLASRPGRLGKSSQSRWSMMPFNARASSMGLVPAGQPASGFCSMSAASSHSPSRASTMNVYAAFRGVSLPRATGSSSGICMTASASCGAATAARAGTNALARARTTMARARKENAMDRWKFMADELRGATIVSTRRRWPGDEALVKRDQRHEIAAIGDPHRRQVLIAHSAGSTDGGLRPFDGPPAMAPQPNVGEHA